MTGQPPEAIHVSRVIRVAPALAFRAWLEPDLIGQWMFGPRVREEQVVRIVTEPRVGGRFSFVVRREGDEIEHSGEYLELDEPRRLVFTWGVPHYSPGVDRVSVDVTPSGAGGCEVAVTHVVEPAYADRCREAWGQMLAALDGLLTGPQRSRRG